MEEADADYEMIMPFVVVTSVGGPYEDHAFVAGIRFGEIDRILTSERPDIHEVYAETPLVIQLDLLAMHLGYHLAAVPWVEHPEWTHLTFTLQST